MRLQYAIGDTIRRIRTEQGKTLRQVADKQYMSFNYLSEIERGNKTASPDILEAIARGLKITTAELIGEIYGYLEEQNNV